MKKSELDRIVAHEDQRLAPSTDTSLRLTRRALLKRVAVLAAAWTVHPWQLALPPAFGQEIGDSTQPRSLPADLDPSMIMTLEAFADTLIPGEKRSADDRAIAGAVSGAGAVQAGALDLMTYAPVGLLPVLSGIPPLINLYALAYAVLKQISLDSTVPPLVALDFPSRTDLLTQMLDPDRKDKNQPLFYGLASICFVAFSTAANLPTVDAIRGGHPGLVAIGFPLPNADGLWRFPVFSYQRVVAKPHPHSKHGNPA